MFAAQLAALAQDVTGCCERNRTGGPSAPERIVAGERDR